MAYNPAAVPLVFWLSVTTETKRAIEERLRRVGGRSHKAALLENLAEIRRR